MKKVYLIIFALVIIILPISKSFASTVDSLFIVGGATPIGWDITKAIKLKQNGNVFTYEGNLVVGEFKFPVNRNSDWNQNMYMKNPDNDTEAYLHIGGQPDDNKWKIMEAGNYTVTIDVASLYVEIILNFDPSSVPAQLYMVGDATPNGWAIDKAVQLAKSGNTFIWDGLLKPGSFKFPVNRNTDWGQNMYMCNAQDSAKFYKHIGGASDDVQWKVKAAGWYHVELNFALSSIKYKPIQIYMVGSASSIGWDIGNAIQFSQDADSSFLFSSYEYLVPGELKFPINQQTDWAQDMYMKDTKDTTKMYYHTGGATDDIKWKIGTAGWYTINVDVKHFKVEFINAATSGIQTKAYSKEIKLLSNMVDEKLVVTNINQFNYQMFNITGALLKQGNSSNGMINVDDLKSGIYLLKLNDNTTSFSAVKFLKK